MSDEERYWHYALQNNAETLTLCCGKTVGSMYGTGQVVTIHEDKVTCPLYGKRQRPNWDNYFLGIATAVSARADCTRRQVGAVIVDVNRRIIGTGYNGAYPGGPSCLKGQCPRGLKSTEEVAPGSSYDTGAGTCIALHAEQNALNFSDYSERLNGTIYITCEPCEGCMRQLLGSGLRKAVWTNPESVHGFSVKILKSSFRLTQFNLGATND